MRLKDFARRRRRSITRMRDLVEERKLINKELREIRYKMYQLDNQLLGKEV